MTAGQCRSQHASWERGQRVGGQQEGSGRGEFGKDVPRSPCLYSCHKTLSILIELHHVHSFHQRLLFACVKAIVKHSKQLEGGVADLPFAVCQCVDWSQSHFYRTGSDSIPD
ncbi:hypothetical protein EYF80_002344 [Liparis tanakae]|uniref:Uncharacterized protein n=1 Tax=Liparis tanakae TaxID=230148 RepID=A0A4Z2JCW2_9TELE|nr:hypothetical protein EYF80_002344 [Liparis tanakae]